MVELNGTPDTYIAGMMDAARIVRERKGKYTLEQTANYLESLVFTETPDPLDVGLARYLSREYKFSSQDDTTEAMEMGKELFEAGKKLSGRG